MPGKNNVSKIKIPLPLWFMVIFLAISSLVRLILMILNFGDISSEFYMLPVSMIVGFVYDLYVGLYVTLPLALLMLIIPRSWRQSRWLNYPISFFAWLFTFGLLYLGITEIYFFDEFNSRLNYIAVDYLIYPHEVFINIWNTYPVLTALIATALIALLVTWLTRKIRSRNLPYPDSRKARFGMVLGYGLLLVIGLFGLNIDSSRIGDNRVLNEITCNGIYTLLYAGFTNELDYNQYYARIDKKRAVNRLRNLLDDDHSTFIYPDSSSSIARHVVSDNPLRKYNIVLVIEESFGSNFIGNLHPDGKQLTPEFDRIAAEHGTLFTHIYATGNRTVRGIEATLASYPPIPGRSIVKRPGNEQIFTLPSILKEKGYNTIFMYGGLSYFDNIGSFASHNDYDRVIDEMDFKNPTFKTIWGVCDEDLFNKALVMFDSLDTHQAPFFATLLTVSNHSPYTYPPGRIPFDPEEHRREYAVRYADYAIGKFIDDARNHAFFDSTLFVFVADHGARVYGSEQIPMRSYEIPLLFYSSTLIPSGNTDNVLGSQMDIAPTILDFLGMDYNSEFFGRSLLLTDRSRERVLMSHNRDVALMRDSTISVLGIRGNRELWQIDPRTSEFRRADTLKDSSLVNDAIAYYMTAFDMFERHRLHPLPQSEGPQ